MIRIFDNLQQLSHASAQLICDAAQKSISEKGNFSLVLSGGETPRTTYELLAGNEFRSLIDWDRVKIFFGDERYVPHTDKESNFRMASETLLHHVPLPQQNIFPIATDSTPKKDALKYEEVLKKNFPHSFPHFDLVLLGLGEDGHTASLFPHTSVLHEHSRWVKKVYDEDQKSYRITLTPPPINAAAQIMFLVSGKKKSRVLYQVLKGKKNPDELPAQLIRGNIIWMLEQEAARLLKD
jgi:6-phosphogluconolactonase